MIFCTRLPNFVKIGAPTAEIWRHIHFSRWRPRPVSYLLMSLPSEGQSLSANQISSRYLNWRLRYNYFRFRNTNVAILEFYFRFRSQPLRCNLHVILHHATEFRPNRSSRCGNMTTYQFSRWLPRPLNTTSSFVFVDLTAFSRLKIYQQTKFRWHISIQFTAEI